METSILELKNLIQGFKLSCQTEGLSPKTTEWYVSFVTRFVRFLQLRDLPTDLENIKGEHVRGFIRYLQIEARTPRSDKPLSPATVQGYVRSLKAFFTWIEKEEYGDGNIMRKIPVRALDILFLSIFFFPAVQLTHFQEPIRTIS
jgi:site-specific recombinase XerD